ncbi:MAG: hypothetical protein K2G03_03370, partial [Bacilli bacterium]|nr:hypothetical protein [Bacilli bacterium]
MKYVLNFFGSLICVIISWCIAIFLIALTALNSTEFLIKEDLVKQLVVDVDIVNLVGEESFTEINNLLEDSGIPKEYVNYVIENKEVKEYLGEYASDAINYVLNQDTMPQIEAKELTYLLINSFDSVVEDVNSNKINIDKKVSDKDIEKVHNTINKYVPKIIEEIPDVQKLVEDELNDSEEYQSTRRQIEEFTNIIAQIKKGYSYKYLFIVFSIVGLLLMVLIKFKSSKLLNWLRAPFFTAGLVYVLLIIESSYFMKTFFPTSLSFLKGFIDNNMNRIISIWKRDAFI